MRNQFLNTLSTPSVQAAQARSYGHSRGPRESQRLQLLGPEEQAFIAVRDSFYLATIGEDGWPYVQHRGGPKGFVRVLGERQLAFGDYNGNRQLISTGNVAATQRVALFFMDYPARERLKVIGYAQTLAPAEAGDLAAQLTVPAGAVIERVFRIEAVGFDWNCPKYITPRFTADEVAAATEQLRARIVELETELRHGAGKSPV
jgi:predicted pyridoxine 5'-phosphate oxidase superfamily flavin-nucleotide-binding protein